MPSRPPTPPKLARPKPPRIGRAQTLGEQITEQRAVRTAAAGLYDLRYIEAIERIAEALVGIAGAITNHATHVGHVVTAIDRGTAQLAAAICSVDPCETLGHLGTAIERAGDTLAEAVEHHASITAHGPDE